MHGAVDNNWRHAEFTFVCTRTCLTHLFTCSVSLGRQLHTCIQAVVVSFCTATAFPLLKQCRLQMSAKSGPVSMHKPFTMYFIQGKKCVDRVLSWQFLENYRIRLNFAGRNFCGFRSSEDHPRIVKSTNISCKCYEIVRMDVEQCPLLHYRLCIE